MIIKPTTAAIVQGTARWSSPEGAAEIARKKAGVDRIFWDNAQSLRPSPFGVMDLSTFLRMRLPRPHYFIGVNAVTSEHQKGLVASISYIRGLDHSFFEWAHSPSRTLESVREETRRLALHRHSRTGLGAEPEVITHAVEVTRQDRQYCAILLGLLVSGEEWDGASIED